MTLPKINRLLIVQLADIGDLILTTPALSALRQTFPDTQIDMLTSEHAAPILNGSGLIDNVIVFDKWDFDRLRYLLKPANWRKAWQLARRLRTGHYDAVLIFHHLTTRFGALKYAALALATGAPCRFGLDNGRGWFLTDRVIDLGFGAKHEAEYWLAVVALLGAQIDDHRLRIGISDADRAWATAHLPADNLSNPSQPLIVIHPGSGGYSLARRWEPEKFAALADTLHQDNNATIIIVGGPKDGADTVIRQMQHTPINLAEQTTLNQLAAILEHCQVYIGADSGVMHLATAAPTRNLIALFGPSNHYAWQPLPASSTAAMPVVVRSGVRCSPCMFVAHNIGLRNGCEARTCMKLIQPAHISEALAKRINPFANLPVLAKSTLPFLRILGITVHILTFANLLDQIGQWIGDSSPRQICTVNPEFMIIAQHDLNFFSILNRADLCIPDGGGLLWAARQLGYSLPERVTGSDGVPLIAERATQDGWRLFLLGAAPGIAEKTAVILCQRYPGLQIAGTYAGSPAAAEEDAIVALINASHADILFVAYGAPNQDKWIARNLPRLQVSVAMGVGGSFDFIAGITRRAPLWMRRAGLEWLYRLIRQPWRWRRMLRLPRFVIAVLRRGEHGPKSFTGGKP